MDNAISLAILFLRQWSYLFHGRLHGYANVSNSDSDLIVVCWAARVQCLDSEVPLALSNIRQMRFRTHGKNGKYIRLQKFIPLEKCAVIYQSTGKQMLKSIRFPS